MEFNQHFTFKKILCASFFPIIMMLFTSLYSVVDGLFLSNYAGKTAFAAVGFILPYLMMFNSVGFMFGTGGSALIAKKLGEEKEKQANEIFSSLVFFSIGVGIFLTGIAQIFLRPMAILQGATGVLLEESVQYGRIYVLGTWACILQNEFQALYSTSGKSKLGFISAMISGILNIVLDAIFLSVFSWGITGAAVATIMSQIIGGIFPLIYYGKENPSQLQLQKGRFCGKELLKICGNGSSEMINNISISIVSFFYNIQLISYAGSNGIAAYGIMNYVNFLFTAVFWGYISGMAPIISFHFGAKNNLELHNLLQKSIVLIGCCSLGMFLLSEGMARSIVAVYAGYDIQLFKMAVHGFHLFAFSFLFAGFSIFFSSFFTALNNGLISGFLSVARVFLFQIPLVLFLPSVFKLEGIWLSLVIAELLCVVLGSFFLIRYRKKYKY